MDDAADYELVPTHRLSFRRRVALWCIVAALTYVAIYIFAVIVWPTAYLYDHDGGRLIRIHRQTGAVSVIGDSGWQPLRVELRPDTVIDSTRLRSNSR